MLGANIYCYDSGDMLEIFHGTRLLILETLLWDIFKGKEVHPATGGTRPHSNYLEMHVPVTNIPPCLKAIRIFKRSFVSNSVAEVYTEHYPLLNPSNYNNNKKNYIMFYAH